MGATTWVVAQLNFVIIHRPHREWLLMAVDTISLKLFELQGPMAQFHFPGMKVQGVVVGDPSFLNSRVMLLH